MPSLSLVIPAYNEELAVESVARRALETLRACSPDHELIILDDASTDRTWEIIERLRAEDPAHVRTIRHPQNRGIAVTIEDLYAAATKDYVFITAGDGQYPPESLKDIVPLLDRYDIVACVRRTKQYTWLRHIVSFGFRLLPVLFFGVDLKDPGGTKCMKREIIRDVKVRSTSVFVEAERVIRAVRRGYRLGFVEIDQRPRAGGKGGGGKPSVILASVRDLLACWWELVVLKRAP